MTAVGIACRYLGLDNPDLFKDALKAFDRAITLDATNVDAKIAVGDLFLEKYNSADAQAAFEEVLGDGPVRTARAARARPSGASSTRSRAWTRC